MPYLRRAGDVHVDAAGLPAIEYMPTNFQLNMDDRGRGNMIWKERRRY
jgi:hypothetical protein